MRLLRRCSNGYRHYWVLDESTVSEVGSTVEGISMGERQVLWDREIVLECARCSYVIYIDSVVRTYFGVKADDDWGT
jgi:hypothetical protein